MTKLIASIVTLSLAFAAGVILGAHNNQPKIKKIAIPSKSHQRQSTEKLEGHKVSAVQVQKTDTKVTTAKKATKANLEPNKFLNKKRTGYTVLLSSFKVEDNANKYAQKIAKKGYDAFYFSKDIKGKVWHRVGVGSFSSKSTAESLKKQLEENRLGKGSLITTIPKYNVL